MAHSLIGADRRTQLKILGVALVAGAVFVTVGLAARVGDFETMAAMMQDQPVVKAGKPVIYTTGYDQVIR
jgi:hypothetical protein